MMFSDVAEAVARIFVDMLRNQPGIQTQTLGNLCQAAAQGNLELVKQIMRAHPNKVCNLQIYVMQSTSNTNNESSPK